MGKFATDLHGLEEVTLLLLQGVVQEISDVLTHTGYEQLAVIQQTHNPCAWGKCGSRWHEWAKKYLDLLTDGNLRHGCRLPVEILLMVRYWRRSLMFGVR
jgi:hypothetical protein